MAKELFTDAQVDAEITRLLNSPAVKLAKKDEQIRNRKRQYMYCLRSLEKKGLVLAERGVTIESLLEALENFEGTSVVVTHDEALLHAFAKRLIVFDGGECFVFEGT